MSNARYMEPMVQRLFDLVKQNAPKDEEQAKQMAEKVSAYIEIIQQLEQSRKAIYQNARKKIELDNEAVSLEAIDEQGATPLLYAVKRGHILIVEELLTAKVSPEKTNQKTGETPLSWSAYEGHALITQALLLAKADPNKTGEEGVTPIYWASQKAHISCIEALLAAKADPDKANAKGGTPLTEAAGRGNVLIVQTLLQAKANPNKAVDDKGITPLLNAIQKGHVLIVQELLTAKAIPDIDETGDVTQLTLAVEIGHVQITQLLLEAKADPNKASNNGTRPLTFAAQKGRIQIIRALLEAKADPNKVNEASHATPLMYAAFNGHTDTVEILIYANANVDISTEEGTTALGCAVTHKSIEVVSLLLKEQASICNPKKLIEFLLSYDPRDPNVLICLNVLSKQQNNLRKLNVIDASLLSDDDYQAMEKYRNELSKVGEKLGREALKESLGNILPSALINMITKLDAPLYRLNDSPTLFSNKKEVDEFREEITKKYKEFCP